MAAPAPIARRASSADRTLTSNRATPNASGDGLRFGRLELGLESREQPLGTLQQRSQAEERCGAGQIGQDRVLEEGDAGDVSREQAGERPRVIQLGDEPGAEVTGEEEEREAESDRIGSSQGPTLGRLASGPISVVSAIVA